jgi:hypothetical protein
VEDERDRHLRVVRATGVQDASSADRQERHAGRKINLG